MPVISRFLCPPPLFWGRCVWKLAQRLASTRKTSQILAKDGIQTNKKLRQLKQGYPSMSKGNRILHCSCCCLTPACPPAGTHFFLVLLVAPGPLQCPHTSARAVVLPSPLHRACTPTSPSCINPCTGPSVNLDSRRGAGLHHHHHQTHHHHHHHLRRHPHFLAHFPPRMRPPP